MNSGRRESPYSYTHSVRCLQHGVGENTRKPGLGERKIMERIGEMHAWEARKLLHIEELRVKKETKELNATTFTPNICPGTIRILQSQEAAPITTNRSSRRLQSMITSCPNSRPTSSLITCFPATVWRGGKGIHVSAGTYRGGDSSCTHFSGSSTSTETVTARLRPLSPVYQPVSYKAGCNLDAIAKRTVSL